MSTPIDRAVPITLRMQVSMEPAFVSLIFVSAMERTWSIVSLPTFFLFGVGDPLERPSSF